ncbi:MAG: pyridoxal phosphate-dependent aminotransferase [Planctomycetota bacterium]|nr:pyridoxal phosphate-dependent aminotransferase [Planctomycetota bacterium]
MTTKTADPEGARAAFRDIPFMGVIYVVAEAMKLGFVNGDPDWCNLGQGQPEVGTIEGAPARYDTIRLEPMDHAYGHINGVDPLVQRIAEHYNRLYRQGKRSQYGPENVAVCMGGRLMLSRTFAALGAIRVGYQTPDYTAYEDMFDYHRHRLTPVHLPAQAEHGFRIPAADYERAIVKQRLGAFLFSNPCNPTGQVVQGPELAHYVRASREHGCALISDEFYSHFIYTPDGQPGAGPISAAAHVEDVEDDPVLIIDGLTKSYRYPGWRIGWAVGPKRWIDTLGRAASAIDGGPARPMQRAALDVLEPARADQETNALRVAFAKKRNLMLERLRRMGIEPAHESESTFYVWGSIAKLPAPFNNADVFFRRALERKVMTVPGRFFDVNPGKERTGPSRFDQYMRFSFGPPYANVELGLDRIEAMLQA